MTRTVVVYAVPADREKIRQLTAERDRLQADLTDARATISRLRERSWDINRERRRQMLRAEIWKLRARANHPTVLAPADPGSKQSRPHLQALDGGRLQTKGA